MKLKPTLLLRIAIAFAFLYPAIDSIIEPNAWLGYFPPALLAATASIVSGVMLLHLWSIVEIIIALWILSGKYIFIPALLATISLLLIVSLNIPLMEIVFRDLALALVSLTLAIQNYTKKSRV
jgi:hypothetical protein